MTDLGDKSYQKEIQEYKEGLVEQIAQNAKRAANQLSSISSHSKDRALYCIAENILKNEDYIIEQNKIDLERAYDKGLSSSMIDRLKLDSKRISSMVEGIRQIATLNDPVGEITGIWKRPNGLMVGKMRIPLGVIGIIYESRPNVTADASCLCLKAGNAVILRGGSEAIRSNMAIGEIIRESLVTEGLPAEAVQIVPVVDRSAIVEMLKLDELIDLIIPRGGEGLIRFVSENSSIPVLKHYKGVCHVYIDAYADLEKARTIAVNSKVQRPSVCNAMETLLIDEKIAERIVPSLVEEFKSKGVRLKGCERTRSIVVDIEEASEEDWYNEYLDLILNIKIVAGIDEAIEHIEKYGSMHTDAIVTESYSNANYFVKKVGSSAVMVNASTRFNDGFELGLGAEIGISTTKLHAFGPMGVNELTTTKFVVYGDGQVKS